MYLAKNMFARKYRLSDNKHKLNKKFTPNKAIHIECLTIEAVDIKQVIKRILKYES